MSPSMQAAVVEAFGKPLALREMAIPAVGPGQIFVKQGLRRLPHRFARRQR